VIFRRLLFLLAGATALAVSAGIVVVALAFALYALAEPYVGRAGASGIVALAAAILIGLLGFVLAMAGRPKPRKPKPGEPDTITDRIFDFVRSKPVTSIAGAVAVGVLAVRNPGYLGSLIRAFVEGRDTPRGRRGR
jgi:hypothetical protein